MQWCICVYLYICVSRRIWQFSLSTLQTWHTLTNMTHFKCCSFPKLWDEICQTTLPSTVECLEMKIIWLNVFPCKTDLFVSFLDWFNLLYKNWIEEKHPAKDMSAGCTDFQINTNSAFKIPNRGAFPCLWSLEEFIMPEYLMSCSILQVVVEKLEETKNLLCLNLLWVAVNNYRWSSRI